MTVDLTHQQTEQFDWLEAASLTMLICSWCTTAVANSLNVDSNMLVNFGGEACLVQVIMEAQPTLSWSARAVFRPSSRLLIKVLVLL